MADEVKNIANGECDKHTERYKKMIPQNKRRKSLGIKVNHLEQNSSSFFGKDKTGYIRNYSFDSSLFNEAVFSRSDRWKMLHRARVFLSRRVIDDSLDCRFVSCRDKRKISSVLDLFPALKYSYSAPLPSQVIAKKHNLSFDKYAHSVRFFDIFCNANGSSKKARFHDLSRSGSIRLDPVDSVRKLFLYRCRIQRCITWGYSVGLVPLMMTVTLFHRWHSLKGLLNVLRDAWNDFFTSSTAAVKRARKMGLQGYIRRAEETINNCGGLKGGGYNSGWHPHYHVILFVPADKVSVVLSMEDELREAWFCSVSRFFVKEFGESIAPSYKNSFIKHGLFFSKVCYSEDSGEFGLRHVDNSMYMAKVMGCDSSFIYCGDKEMTNVFLKNSRVPFDLLLEDTAENNDLWVEYALATKGLRSFVFSHGLESRVNTYFNEHPDVDPIKPFVRDDMVVAQLDTRLYKFVERNFKIDEMLSVAINGYDSLCDWFRKLYVDFGFSVEDITDDMLPLRPGSRTLFGGVTEFSVFCENYNCRVVSSSNDFYFDSDNYPKWIDDFMRRIKKFPVPLPARGVPFYIGSMDLLLFDDVSIFDDYVQLAKLSSEGKLGDFFGESPYVEDLRERVLDMQDAEFKKETERSLKRRRELEARGKLPVRRADGSEVSRSGAVQGSLIELGLLGSVSLSNGNFLKRDNRDHVVWIFDKQGNYVSSVVQPHKLTSGDDSFEPP